MKRQSLIFGLLVSTAVGAFADEQKPAAPAAPAAPASPAAPQPPAPGSALHKEIVGVIPGVMQYDKKEFTVKAGVKVAVLFTNKGCPLQHNWILVKPGTDAAYGKAADDMIIKDPAGALKSLYQPESPDVLAKTSKLVGIGQSDIIEFTAPAEPGDYPYVCTFPGHRFLMKGVMHVTK
ncbi:MAG: plastocyanin/azurin family copper-binding protein [Verrucomicrobiales bacterium]